MASIQTLKQRLARTLKARRLDAALLTLSALEEREPAEPSWPRRAARLLRARADAGGELAALGRALEIQVDRGQVLDAIATCQSILEIDPQHARTLETLDLLYLNAGTAPEAGTERAPETAVDPEAPLDSLHLTQVVPGARSVELGDATPGCVNEIPVDGADSPDEEVIDLHLDQWSSKHDILDLAAAQAVSLPPARKPASGGERGASLRSELANIPLFGDLDPSSLHTLIRKVRVVTLEPGQVLFREGDAANSLYVIVDGAVIPIAEGERRRKLAVLERGEFFGETGLLTKQPRNATIEALVGTKLLAIDRRVLWELIGNAPSVAKSLVRFLRARLIDRQIRTNLFFSAFAHAEREEIARQFRVLEVARGTRIVEKGRPPEGLFVVLSGTLELVDPDRGKPLGELGSGDMFGGLALIEDVGSRSDIVAQDKCWVVVLGEGRFRRILDANPRLVRVVKRIAAEQRRARQGRPSVQGL